MAMSALMTLSGLANYRPDLFDNLVLPVAPVASEMGVEAEQMRQTWSVDKDDFVDYLMLHTYGLCLAYPDADFMKSVIGTWSKAHITEWQRLFETLFYKYNPLWNKDGRIVEVEEVERENDNSETTGGLVSNNSTVTGYTHGYNGGTVHADDGLTWEHADKTKGINSTNSSGTRSGNESGTESREKTTTEQGNIGVTMSQDLIAKQREIAMLNIEEVIAEAFKKQFCLMVY